MNVVLCDYCMTAVVHIHFKSLPVKLYSFLVTMYVFSVNVVLLPGSLDMNNLVSI